MRLSKEPILTITKAWFADSVRAVKSRVPGAFESLRNLVPNLSDGIGRLRTGYSAYDGSNQGLTPPTGMEITKIVPIQSPAQDDVHIYFCSNSGQKVYINPWYQGSTRQSTDLQLNTQLTLIGKAVTYPTANQMTLTSPPGGMSATVDFYKGYLFVTGSKKAIVTGYNGSNTFTFLQDVDGSGLNFGSTVSGAFYHSFHDNTSFAPAYNTDLANAPTANAENSIIRFCGGQASGNDWVWVNPHLKTTFFPSAARPLAFEGTYASKRQLVTPAQTDIAAVSIIGGGSSDGLPSNKTYWPAVSLVYEGGQIAPPTEYATGDIAVSGGSLTSNYVQDGQTARMAWALSIDVSILNKRAIGVLILMAQDDGDTHLTGRVSDYFTMLYIPITSTVGLGARWTYSAPTFIQTVAVSATGWNAKGGVFSLEAGYPVGVGDTMYSASTEEIIGQRRVLTNAYVTSESLVDRQNIFTNPVGGSAIVGNAGVLQPDLFPNLNAIYRLRVQPTTGTQINALVATGIQEFLVLKDRGIGLCRLTELTDGIPVLDMRVESKDVGCSTLNAWAKDDNGVIYFPSYQDIYAYRSGQLSPLIEREDKNDWLDTYRNTVSSTDKQNAVVIYLPELKAMMFLFGNQKSTSTGYNGMQYVLFPADGRWAELRLKEATAKATCSFKYVSSLQNGHVICTTTDSTAVNKRLTWKYNGTQYVFYFSDDGTAINYYLKQGALSVGGSEAMDAILDKIVLNRTLTSTTTGGTLDCGVIKDGGSTRTFGGLTKTLTRLPLKFAPTDAKIGARWDLIVNSNSSPEVTSSGDTIQIDSIEYHGRTRPRILRTTE